MREVSKVSLANDGSEGWFSCTTEHLEQTRLSRTITTDDADLVASCNDEGCVLNDGLASDFNGESLHLQHDYRLSGMSMNDNASRRLIGVMQVMSRCVGAH